MNTCVIASLFFLLVSSTGMMVQGDPGDPYSEDECGETRGCFDCRDSVSTCAVNVAWEPDSDEGVVKFTLWGSKTGNEAHVSVGITATSNMYNADVYSCISDDTGDVMARSRNPPSGRATNPRDLIGVYGQEVSVVDGEIRCQFYRNMSLADDENGEFVDISGSNRYYLILSAGEASGGSIRGHSADNRGYSSSTFLLSQAPAATSGRYGIWTLIMSLVVAFHVSK